MCADSFSHNVLNDKEQAGNQVVSPTVQAGMMKQFTWQKVTQFSSTHLPNFHSTALLYEPTYSRLLLKSEVVRWINKCLGRERET